MLALLTYDIESDRLRKKIADTLIAIGLERIQYSVFMGSAPKEKLQAYLNKIESDIGEEDRVYVIPLDSDHVSHMMSIGVAPEIDLILGKVHTLFF